MTARLLTTWHEIEVELFAQLAALPPPKPRVEKASTNMFAHRPVWANSVRHNLALTRVHAHCKDNPDSTLNTLRYLFFHMRCGILVCIRGGAVRVFQPFANQNYTNNWSERLTFADATTSADYQTTKEKLTGMRPESWLPPHKWWLNGGIVCSVQPSPEIWGSAHLAELQDMLRHACASSGIPDCDFFINKRDYPQLKADASEPYSRFIGDAPLCREAYTSYAPVLSFYGGADFADCTMPLTEDWKRARDTVEPLPEAFASEWSATAQVAVWRGTATGNGLDAGSNPRLRLASFASKHLDAGLTGFNLRDKVRVRADGQVEVNFLRPRWTRVPFMSLEEQVARFRYVVYVDGHCAANRYTALMHSCRTILRVTSERLTDGGLMWSLFDLVPARVGADGSVDLPPHADHFAICSDLSNLECTIEFLQSHDDVARQVATSAYNKCPTKQDIVCAWEYLLFSVHDLTTHVAPLASPETVFFSPYECKYARLATDEGGLFSCKV